MEKQNVPIETWNINKHRPLTNHTVEGRNFKLNSTMGKQEQNVFLLVQKLKEEAKLVPWQLKSNEPRQEKDLCKKKKELHNYARIRQIK